MTNEVVPDNERRLPKCPACEYTMQRIGRTFFMRMLIGSKRYYCRDCRREYIRFLGYYFACSV